MNDAVIDERRRALALEAFHELDSILETLPTVGPDRIRAVRGMAMRAQTLLWIVYGSSGLDPQWSSFDEDRMTLYGVGAPPMPEPAA